MTSAPRARAPDSTLQLMREPYRYLGRTARATGSDIFETRLMLQPVTCLTGPDAARFFYETDALRRKGATPPRLRNVLFGKGGIQGTDGAEHRHRKAMFMSLMSDAALDRLVDCFDAALGDAVPQWLRRGKVDLYPALQQALMAAVCDWSGIPLARDEVPGRAETMSDMFEHAGGIGPSYWRGKQSRRQANAWAETLVERFRAGEIEAAPDAPAATIARWTGTSGDLLPVHAAAVDLLSLIRATIAVSVFGIFCAHALHRHSALRGRVRDGEDYRLAFVQEVRRAYPFFPAVAAIATRPVSWREVEIPQGRRVTLDIYGTDHDARSWEAPDSFRPERFLGWPGDPYAMIPQGGGDHLTDHRCAGEWITIRLVARICRLLTAELDYTVEGDPEPDFSAMPAVPKGGFVVGDLRPADRASDRLTTVNSG